MLGTCMEARVELKSVCVCVCEENSKHVFEKRLCNSTLSMLMPAALQNHVQGDVSSPA